MSKELLNLSIESSLLSQVRELGFEVDEKFLTSLITNFLVLTKRLADDETAFESFKQSLDKYGSVYKHLAD